MTDFEVRQRLQTSTFGEGKQLIKWVNSSEVAERLGDPTLAMVPVNTIVIRSAPWAIYPGVSMNVPSMTASIHIAERNEVDTILSLAVKHPSYRKSSSRLLPPLDKHDIVAIDLT
jgi:peroxiredoxin